MTLAARNTVLIVGAVLTTLALFVYLAVAYLLLYGPLAGETIAVPETQQWFGFSWSVGRLAALRSLGAAGVLGLVATVGATAAIRLFRRVSSAEIYFMTLFVMTLSIELLRIAQPLVNILDQPPVVGVVVTRLVLFGRLYGALALFAAGIYAAGADYPRIGTVSALIAALVFLIIYFVPVDGARMNATFVHVTGGREGIDLMLAFLSIATLLNYAIAWQRGHRERGGAITLAVTALVVGQQLTVHLPAMLPLVAGLILTVGGVVSFLLVNRSYYLWY